MRDLLANNQIAYRWLEVDEEPARRLLAEAELGTDRLPVVLLPDVRAARRAGSGRGRGASRPADGGGDGVLRPRRRRRRTRQASPLPSTARPEGLRTVVVERRTFGGQAGMSSRIENYLGFPVRAVRRGPRASRDDPGTPFSRRAADGAGGDRHRRRRQHPRRAARGRHGDRSHTVLLAPGVSYRRLDAEGRRSAYRAGHLVRHGVRRRRGAARRPGSVRRRRGELGRTGGAPPRQRGARDDPLPRREPAEVDVAVPRRPHRGDAGGDHRPPEHARSCETHGEDALESITIDEDGARLARFRPRRCSSSSAPSRTRTGSARRRPARTAATSSPAARCWTCPRTARPGRWRRHPLALETSVPGVFAAGDVRDQSIKRVASAVGEGSMAVLLVHQYLKRPLMDPGELRRITILADLPDERLAELARHGTELTLDGGEYLFRERRGGNVPVAAARRRARDDALGRR